MTQTLDREANADVTGNPAFESMVARLSKLSVDKHFEAYVDIDWDDPELAVDPTDHAGRSGTSTPWVAPTGTGRYPARTRPTSASTASPPA